MKNWNHSGFVWLIVGFFLCWFPLAGIAEEEGAADDGSILIRLGREHFDPLKKAPGRTGEATGVQEERGAQAGPGYYIVQFDGPVREEWKDALEAQGAELFDYIPDFAFIVRMDASRLEAVQVLPHVRWAGDYRPAYKLSQKALDNQLEAGSDRDQRVGARSLLKVIIFPGEDVDRIRGDILLMNGEVVQESIRSGWDSSFIIRFPAKRIEELGTISGIKWIAPAPKRRLHNNVSTDVISARTPRTHHRLYGEGQTVGVCDTGLDIGENDPKRLHTDFLDGKGKSRVVKMFDATGGDQPIPDTDGHGTHVAGSIIGNGARSGSDPGGDNFPSTCFSGMAPKANLIFHADELAGGTEKLSVDQMLDQSRTAGAHLHSNSWGNGLAGSYSSESKEIDQYIWGHRDFLVFFSAGNSGVDKDADGVVDLYAVDDTASAKNCLAVGASEGNRPRGGGLDLPWGQGWPRAFSAYPIQSDHVSNKPGGMAAFSSRGPTLDGRTKPDLVAPGTNILSTRSSVAEGSGWGPYDNHYMWMGGTSMSTPITAGTAALVREYLNKVIKIATPSAALLKAAMLNGAQDITPGQYGTGRMREIPNAPVPNNVEGWGRLNLARTIYPKSPETILYYDENKALKTGESTDHHVTVTTASVPFKINLAWSDYPGSEVAQGGLVNDLDLQMISPSGKIHYADNANKKPGLSFLKYTKKDEPDGQSADSMAVRFTPVSYPAHIDSVTFVYFNSEDAFSDVTVAVYDDKGSRSLPGTLLFKKNFTYIPPEQDDGRKIPAVISLGIAGVVINEGGFYVAVLKDSAHQFICTEAGNAQQRSYRKAGAGWELSKDAAFMFACVRGPSLSTDFDRVNNVLGVTLPKPEVGAYTIRVSGYNVPKGPQPYALVARGGISMTSPRAGSIQFASADYDTTEDAGSVTIQVVRTGSEAGASFGGSTGQLTVAYRTEDGTARAGSDYQPVSGTLTWADGDASVKELVVPILYDNVAEGDERFSLLLEEPSENAWLNSVETADVTIQDNSTGGGGCSGGCFIDSLGP
jgi:hypothetical protein